MHDEPPATTDERFRHVFEASPAGMMISDRRGRIILANREALRLFGYTADEMQGLTIEDLVPERHRSSHADHRQRFVAENQARAMGPEGDLFGLCKDGSEIPIEVGLRPFDFDGEPAVLATILDLSERLRAEEEKQRLEQRLRLAQKMETVGTLAGGIAHDFNNILTPILGHTQLLMDSIAESDPDRECLDEIWNGANRAADLVRQILLFSRQSETEKKAIRLQDLAEEAMRLIRPAIPATVEIRRTIHPCEPILADAIQIHQVILNLCTNAWQAMQEQSHGLLTLAVEPVRVDPELCELYPGLRPGAHARLSVSDTGTGMDQATVEQIFEPFFTTKEVGKGTGLGLSIVHGIVREHDGELVVYSEPGRGTTFHVFFPTAEGATAPVAPSQSEVPRGDERVLVVDDDRAVGNMVKRILVSLGYVVELHGDAPSAWKRLRSNSERFDLLLTDLTMPKMTGLELAARSRNLRADLPVLLMTGYAGDLVSEGSDPPPGIERILHKPLLVQDLASAVRRALDSPERRTTGGVGP